MSANFPSTFPAASPSPSPLNPNQKCPREVVPSAEEVARRRRQEARDRPETEEVGAGRGVQLTR